MTKNEEIVEDLYKKALKVRERAYAPYSNFLVGAALITEDGSIFTGCNVENASYGLSMCAERNAIFSAIAAGKKKIKILVVVGDTEGPISPCGACRQVIMEFKIPNIVLANLKKDFKCTTCDDLLPYSFESKDLDD